MNRLTALPGVGALLLGAALSWSVAPAAAGSPSSDPGDGTHAADTARRDCPVPCQGSITCRLCVVKLELYRSWMEEVGRGVELHPLPDATVAALAPHLPGVDLSAVRVGYTPKQLADGLTDCDRIFLSQAGMAEAIRAGNPLDTPELELFLHELVHAEQCARLGGRDAYALLWFRDVGVGALTLLLTGGHWMGLHGAMPMEAEAAGRAVEILTELEASGR